ncbi:helix-turn-helix domain-containing protein [Exiguobacterium antarcticum]|uniref:Helix-turn-helix domain-containing protein n=1 Tax=Exiguobacterium antarcticum TaxID=132920 RepID=A0ABT6R4M8_9BACL|nr:helix-turn-helix domain-containing protein [Exiguobacterium antarcticum]MDI3235911.1 helix-turn-helix domain-containing protein [Exiguobacterium antarcticum]
MNELNILIGNEIKRIRQERNWTQSELCQGICSQAEISKIENGHNSPTVDLLQKIANRLQVPVSEFFINENEKQTFRTIDLEMTQLMRATKYSEMKKRIDRYLNEITNEDVIILLHYYRLISEEAMRNIDYRTCISQLLNMTMEKQLMEESFLLYVRIQMAIAVLYTNHKEYQHSDTIYTTILRHDYSTTTYKKIKLKILYNYIRNLIKLKKYSLILINTEEAIKESNQLNDISYLGHFYYQRGYAFEQLSSSHTSIQDAYTIAYGIFLATENNSYAKILEDHLRDSLYFTLG